VRQPLVEGEQLFGAALIVKYASALVVRSVTSFDQACGWQGGHPEGQPTAWGEQGCDERRLTCSPSFIAAKMEHISFTDWTGWPFTLLMIESAGTPACRSMYLLHPSHPTHPTCTMHPKHTSAS
jgi:hypothetical protein